MTKDSKNQKKTWYLTWNIYFLLPLAPLMKFRRHLKLYRQKFQYVSTKRDCLKGRKSLEVIGKVLNGLNWPIK